MKTYNVLNKLVTEVKVTENPYDFEPELLFDMAMRINKKRSFLFVSKVLGKHLAVAPQIPIMTGHLLAHRFLEIRQAEQQKTTARIVEALKQKTWLGQALEFARSQPLHSQHPLHIIGFAETATALGHAFFDAFTGDVHYIHTTRELLVDREPTLSFEEEHSHASSHRLYADASFFEQAEEVVLVDDEMTTGQTNMNIIRQLHAAYPHIKLYTLVSILDWRSEAHEAAMHELAAELKIKIGAVSLMKGQFTALTTGELPTAEAQSWLAEEAELQITSLAPVNTVTYRSLDTEERVYEASYFKGSGRFSLTTTEQRDYYASLQQVAEALKQQRVGRSSLVLGTGEFMFAPMYIASHMGEGVSYHSTTRSPIYAHEDSLIYAKHMFKSAEYPGVINYLYNIPAGEYDDIFLVFERILDKQALVRLVSQLKPLTKQVHIVTVGGEEHAKV
ncbi:MAG: phosphoribosyltransferase family protein [Solibacillus sp.]